MRKGKPTQQRMRMYFSDFFGVRKSLNKYGAFDISLLADLPLFVDPFLLFNSKKPKYRALDDRMIEYLRFLKEKSAADQSLDSGLLTAWHMFPEVEQNWLGFSATGNHGHGFLVLRRDEKPKADDLLAGPFHEIKKAVIVRDIEAVDELYKRVIQADESRQQFGL